MMISSSRGTNHLFSVSPSGRPASLQVFDANSTNDDHAAFLAYENGPQSLDVSKLSYQTLYPSGNPMTLSVVSRITNGYEWKDAVTGSAAAATGRVSPLSGEVA